MLRLVDLYHSNISRNKTCTCKYNEMIRNDSSSLSLDSSYNQTSSSTQCKYIRIDALVPVVHSVIDCTYIIKCILLPNVIPCWVGVWLASKLSLFFLA